MAAHSRQSRSAEKQKHFFHHGKLPALFFGLYFIKKCGPVLILVIYYSYIRAYRYTGGSYCCQLTVQLNPASSYCLAFLKCHWLVYWFWLMRVQIHLLCKVRVHKNAQCPSLLNNSYIVVFRSIFIYSSICGSYYQWWEVSLVWKVQIYFCGLDKPKCEYVYLTKIKTH